jgi:hypothetical protein
MACRRWRRGNGRAPLAKWLEGTARDAQRDGASARSGSAKGCVGRLDEATASPRAGFPSGMFCDALDKLDERRARFPAWETVKCLDQSKRSVGRQELAGFISGCHAGLGFASKEECRRHVQSLSNPCEAANRDAICSLLVLLHLLECDAYALGQIGLSQPELLSPCSHETTYLGVPRINRFRMWGGDVSCSSHADAVALKVIMLISSPQSLQLIERSHRPLLLGGMFDVHSCKLNVAV